jgi:hypothetical protein
MNKTPLLGKRFWIEPVAKQEFVTGSHDGGSLFVHRFPDGEVLGSVDSETLFAEEETEAEDEDTVGYNTVFLHPDYILTETRWKRLLLLYRPEMRLVGTVWPAGYQLRGYDDSGKETDHPVDYEGNLTGLYPVGSGKVLIVLEPV